jgi:hypothetical protein
VAADKSTPAISARSFIRRSALVPHLPNLSDAGVRCESGAGEVGTSLLMQSRKSQQLTFTVDKRNAQFDYQQQMSAS